MRRWPFNIKILAGFGMRVSPANAAYRAKHRRLGSALRSTHCCEMGYDNYETTRLPCLQKVCF